MSLNRDYGSEESPTKAASSMVSILIPCFNAERWIGEAIESALGQTYANTEVIVYDDGSTDSSRAVIMQFSDRIRVAGGPNRGGNYARNELLELARGEWLQYLDADDYLKCRKLEVQMAEASVPGTDVVYGPSVFRLEAEEREYVEPIAEPVCEPWIQFFRWGLPQTGASLWRKSAVKEVGGWNVGQPCCQEHELYLRLLRARYCFRYNPEALSVYRVWTEATVSRKNPMQTIRERMNLMDTAYDFLQASGELSKARRGAYSIHGVAQARLAWQFDPATAVEIMARVRSRVRPLVMASPSAPFFYRTTVRTVGFRWAERVAAFSRKLLKAG